MSDWFAGGIRAVNLGTPLFGEALRAQGVSCAQADFRPPRALDAETRAAMETMEHLRDKIERANALVLSRLQNVDPYWLGMRPAIECVPDIREGMVFHSGPDIAWADMCETQRQGGVNGCLFEGYAKTEAEARHLLETGAVAFCSANDYHLVGPGSGIATPSMVVNIVEDRNTGARGYCAPFEGPNRGGLAGWGVYNEAIDRHLRRMREELGPAFTHVVEEGGGLALGPIIARGVEMGDELHSRQDACGLMLERELMRRLLLSDLPEVLRRACADLLYGTVRFFHPLGMASAMAVLESVRHIPYSTAVTAMEGNGVEYGVKIAGLGGEWFRAPSPRLEGETVVAGVGPDEALPWIGDSCMLESTGLGGFAAAAAPAVMRALGRTLRDGVAQSEEMAKIALGEHTKYLAPALSYRGTPTGIDLRRVAETGIEPVIHGGMISKTGRRLGAGIAHVPVLCFERAARAFAAAYGREAAE